MKVHVINALAQTTSRVKATVARVFAFSVLPTYLEHGFIRCENTPSYAQFHNNIRLRGHQSRGSAPKRSSKRTPQYTYSTKLSQKKPTHNHVFPSSSTAAINPFSPPPTLHVPSEAHTDSLSLSKPTT
jgi:hypothetical protein